jgi:hypothetical protein
MKACHSRIPDTGHSEDLPTASDVPQLCDVLARNLTWRLVNRLAAKSDCCSV